MGPRKQDLYLFFEENESDLDVINSRLVSIYMNRYVIDEENQNEITGVYNLMKVPSEPIWHDEKFSTEKGSFDGQMIDRAYNDATQQINTAHFIIGKRFMYDFLVDPTYWFEKWIRYKFKSHFTQSSSTCNWPLVITLLKGQKERITSSGFVENAYFIDDKSFYYPSKKRRRTHEDWPHRSSVHDDLEDQFHNRNEKSGSHYFGHFTHEWLRNMFDRRKLFLCKMLNNSEEAELAGTLWHERWVSKPVADGEPCQLYHFYDCERLTMTVFPS